jgi:hypothetical protein
MRFRASRAVLLTLAGHGVLRHAVEEAIKREFLSRQDVAEIVVLAPPPIERNDEDTELHVRSSAG